MSELSQHGASITWRRDRDDFAYPTYTRDHAWAFPCGTRVEASAAPEFLGDPGRVDPEEAFVAAISACHMLTFLAIAARRRFAVDTYSDAAVGFLEKNGDCALAITRVELHPRIAFGGDVVPTPDQVEAMHHLSHQECFIASSVKTEITVLAPGAR